jgi:hypothetical protein
MSQASEAASSLEYGTKIGEPGKPWGAWWNLKLYPAAGEATAIFQTDGLGSRPGFFQRESRDPAEIAARRARTNIRRYCAANRLNRLGTLTYRGKGCFDQGQLRADVAAFFRRLRSDIDGGAFPYVWVPEWHPGGHGLHLHFAVGRYIRRSFIEGAWPHGFVHIKLIGDLPAQAAPIVESRRVAWYLAPYIAKAFAERREPGMHRYEVARGFGPGVTQYLGLRSDVIDKASAQMGERPGFVSSSDSWRDYSGPPAVFVSWG